jgi:hypothetical protein
VVPNVNRSGKLYHRVQVVQEHLGDRRVPNVNRSGKLYHNPFGPVRVSGHLVPNVNRSGKLYHSSQLFNYDLAIIRP